VYSRYLLGLVPGDYVTRKYAGAFDSGRQQALTAHSRFDEILLYLAAIHPLLTRAVDLYARFFHPAAVVRRRLIMLLAIIETHAQSVARLEQPVAGGMPGLLLDITVRSVISAVLLCVSTVLLLPVQLLSGGHGKD
jgi:hypothetical protein